MNLYDSLSESEDGGGRRPRNFKSQRNRALTPQQQLLTALHWLGNGAQYYGVAGMHGLHKSTVQRCVQNVCQKIVTKLFLEEIRWPTGEALALLPQQFMAVARFPRVAGCIDSSLILIDSLKLNEKAYVDRNGDHSINVMAKRLGSEEWELDADNDESDGEDDDVPSGTVQGKDDVHSSLVRKFAAE
ncbi:hypothetical protein ILUMI_06233 [Ignelater luminosus]|uniref:Nuclease HARBI1 n=1 Tax=Ignelater luminosus TaxID=2038154 RepID=A0A8K0GHE6_IGNLU|nr:hypothetical protein ILUMI_06233 [Ignelater luminosus]